MGLWTQKPPPEAGCLDGIGVSTILSPDITASWELSNDDLQGWLGYLENLVGVPFVHLEVLYGHGISQVFSVTHICESTVVVNTSNTCDLVLENI